MKIAVLGNSHLAALKLAWRDGIHRADFLGGSAGNGGLVRAWRRLDGPPALILADDASAYQRQAWQLCRGDDRPFHLTGCDAVVLVGLIGGARPWHLSHCPIAADVSPLGTLGVAPCSFPQWRSMYGDTYRIETLRRVVELVRCADAPERPILALPSPLPRADAARFSPEHAPPPRWTALPPDLKADLVTNERALVERLGAEVGVRVIHPPRFTLVDGNFCHPRFSRGALGSRNFAGGPPQYGDSPEAHILNIDHKNRAYGAVLAAQVHLALAHRATDFAEKGEIPLTFDDTGERLDDPAGRDPRPNCPWRRIGPAR